MKVFKTESEQREDYNKAVSLQSIGDENSLREAVQLFSYIRNYRDASEREKECNELYQAKVEERETKVQLIAETIKNNGKQNKTFDEQIFDRPARLLRRPTGRKRAGKKNRRPWQAAS